MFYVSVPPIDHGLLEFPTNAYGGFAYRANTLERAATTDDGQPRIPADPTKRFITEHNLGLFWRRPGLFPRCLALPIPLVSTGDAYATGVLNRPPGMMRVDCAPIRYRQRNLLAGEFDQSDGAVSIWAVNDASDHKQLLHYKFSIANSAIGGGGKKGLCRRDQLLFLDDSPGGPIGRVGLASEVLQLKAFVEQNQSAAEGGAANGKVFLRSKNDLQLAHMTEGAAVVSSLFRSQTVAFAQIPHLDDELAVVDARGMLFWGSVDEPSKFTRFKCPAKIKDICPTDCPRILVTIDERECRLLDLREANCAGRLLFTQSFCGAQLMDDGFGVDGPFSEQFHASLVARERLCQVHSVDIGLDTVLVTSSRRHTLVDQRMPGQHLLTMAHTEIDGADYAIVTPPFVDPATGGRVFSLYALTHTKKPALSHWSLIYHPNECLWSSVGSKYELDTPRHAVDQFVRLHTDATTSNGQLARQIEPTVVPKYTRAIHYQPIGTASASSSPRALLFRQMEGGEIWYENVFFDPLPKLRQDDGYDDDEDDGDQCEGSFAMEPIDVVKLRGQCLAKIAQFQTERKASDKAIETHFFEGIQEELMAFKGSKRKQQVDLTALDIASEIVSPEEQNGQNGTAALSPVPSSSSICSSSGAYTSAVYPFAAVHRISADKCATMDTFDHHFCNFDTQLEEGSDEKLFSTAVSQIWHKTLARWQEGREQRAQMELGLLKDEEEVEGRGVEEEEHGKAKDEEDNGEKEEEDNEKGVDVNDDDELDEYERLSPF